MTDQRRDAVATTLAEAGFVAPAQEAEAILAAAAAGRGPLDDLVGRRIAGEPLAWVVGHVRFLDVDVLVRPGVFVPRPQTEAMATRAIELLADDGVAVDLCTGCGALAVVMARSRPRATILGTDLDERAVANARANGVDARPGDLDAPLPDELRGRIDVITAVTPYVPTEELHLLPRDVLEHEPRAALDGGAGGVALALRIVALAPGWLRPGGALLLEIGGDQAEPIGAGMFDAGLVDVVVHADDDGRDRAIEAHAP